jgi:hypothetical protein
MSLENNNINFMGYFVGEVLEIEQPTRKLSVYFPKLMPGIGGVEGVSSSVQTTTNPNVGGLSYSETLRVRNSIWVSPYDFSQPLPSIGSKVLVFFVDGNPKQGFWDKFNPNNSYSVIDEERFPNLFTMRVANSDVRVNSEDSVSIVFPEEFSSVYNEDGKSKRVELFRRENYVVSPSRPDNPFPGQIWFNTSEDGLFVFRGASYSRVITSDEISKLYEEVDRITAFLEDTLEFWTTGRLVFLPRFSSISSEIKAPVENQIVAIDPSVTDDTFYKFTKLDSEQEIEANGFYFLAYENRFIRYLDGITSVLKAYKYNGSSWEELDGWFAFVQPSGDLGDFELGQEISVSGESVLEWDFRSQLSQPSLKLKVYSIKFEGISISEDTEVDLQFYSDFSAAGNTEDGSDIISGISSTSDIREGDAISGDGIVEGSSVIAIYSESEIRISSPSTATASAVQLSFRRNVGAAFSLKNESGELSILPSYYGAANLSGNNLFVPDISRFGEEILNLKCGLSSEGTTLNLGAAILIDARSSEEVS